MDRPAIETTPSAAWLQSWNATCNRLNTQYLQLLRSATVAVTVPASSSESTGPHTRAGGQHDPRGGGGHMKTVQDAPPPPLAAHLALGATSCQMAAENLNVGVSHIMTLIRTLRMSTLLEQNVLELEQTLQLQHVKLQTEQTLQRVARLEQELHDLRQQQLNA